MSDTQPARLTLDMNANGEAVSKWLTVALLTVAETVHKVLGIGIKPCDAFLSYPSAGGGPVAANPIAWEVVEAGRRKGKTTTIKGVSDRPAILLNIHKVHDAQSTLLYAFPAYLSVLIPPEVQTAKADGSPLAGGRRILQFPKAYMDAYAKLGYSGKPDRPVANGTMLTDRATERKGPDGQITMVGGPETTAEVIRRLAQEIEDSDVGAFPTDAVDAKRDPGGEVGRNLRMACSTQISADGTPQKFTNKTRNQEHFSGSTTDEYAKRYVAERDERTGVTYTFWPCPRAFHPNEAERCGGFVTIIPNEKQRTQNAEKWDREHATGTDQTESATGTDGASAQ